MPSVAIPYGMYVRRCYGNRRNTSGCTSFPITADPGGTLYYGAPVGLVAGSLKVIAATPTTAGGVNAPVGIFQGCSWEDKAGVHYSPMLPAGTWQAGVPKKIVAMVCDDPDLVFMIQSDGLMDLTKVGLLSTLVNPNQGNDATGRSKMALAAGAAATATFAVRIVRVLQPADPFPDVLVQWNGGVHQYVNAA